MIDGAYTFTLDSISNINGDAINHKAGYIQGFKDEKGCFIALLIPCYDDELEVLVKTIKNED